MAQLVVSQNSQFNLQPYRILNFSSAIFQDKLVLRPSKIEPYHNELGCKTLVEVETVKWLRVTLMVHEIGRLPINIRILDISNVLLG